MSLTSDRLLASGLVVELGCVFGALLVGEREVANGAVTVCPSTMPRTIVALSDSFPN
jgi:hypothetical protein